jgi:membrane protein required for colicin V production
VVTVLTVRISDMVLDSRVGALDRTLGFLFGLARGLLIVVVAYTFFDWLVPDRGKPGWILHAKSKVVLSSTGDWLKEQLPENAEATILKKLKRQRPEDTETPEPAPDQHGEIDTPAAGRADVGYDRSSRSGMQHLLEARGMAR